MAISPGSTPRDEKMTLDFAELNFVGCASSLDALYASPFARKSAETGLIS
jgi:hypothetical protein